MPKEDYILRQLALLREWVARISGLQKEGRMGEALREAMEAQERLFASPFSEYAALSLADQWQRLGKGETEQGARERRFAYAVLLQQTAYVYRDMHRNDLSAGCLALSAELMGRLEAEPGGLTPDMTQFLASLRAPSKASA